MKHAAAAALLLLLVSVPASALDTSEILGLVAMPLAVAAVSNVTGVPPGDLGHLVSTLNRAEVPPTQVVQVIRYAPAALVVQEQPTFVQYVDDQFAQGVVGPRLVTVIEQRYRTYDVTPQIVTLREPAPSFVLADDYIPPTVIARVAEVRPVVRDSNDLLGLIAMPLAVAAVSDIAGVPMNELSDLVATLNNANVPPLQIVEVLRYVPVALVVPNDQPQFVDYVQTEVANGVTGTALVNVIGDRLRTYDVTPQFGAINPVQVTTIDGRFFPPVVTTRVAEVRSHPHGGPPGQLKKQLGLQTGAEVVHGGKPGKKWRQPQTFGGARVVGQPVIRNARGHGKVKERKAPRPVIREHGRNDMAAPPAAPHRGHEKAKGPRRMKTEAPAVMPGPPVSVPAATPSGAAPGAQGQGHGQGHGQGKPQGGGKGKGKG